jgi:hypothetical protein
MRAAYRPSAILRIVARDADVTAGDDVGDGAEVVATGLLVGAEEGGTDSRVGVLVLNPWVCGGGLVPCVQADTPRPKMTGATTIRTRRVSELFMIDPSGVLG